MKKTILIGCIVIGSSFILINSTFATTTEDASPPHELHILSSADLEALSTLTGSARDIFLESKGITRSNNIHSGSLSKQRNPENSRIDHTGSGNLRPQNFQKERKNPENEITNSGTTTNNATVRAERIAKNQSKILEQKKLKIQKKIIAKESLTRLEKKFADQNGIEYSK